MGGGQLQPKIIEETKCVGGLSMSKWGTQYHQQDRVYKGDIALAQPANLPEGSYKYIVASSGRNPENTSDRKKGSPMEQRLELKKDGCTNTITTVSTKEDRIKIADEVGIKQATKEGSIKCKVGGCYDASYPESKTRRGRVQEGGDVTPTITAQGGENINYIETVYRIRKLTPKECWRLMGYTDEDFENAASVNSNTQLYKEAGNAIVKQVLMAIFAKML